MNQNNNPNNNPNINYNYIPPVYIPTIKQTKNKFLTFVFSLMPGCGQMYQGLMRKGISVMGVFFGIIAVSIMLYIPVMTLALPIVWFYSFFDSLNRMNYSLDELKAVEDDYVINLGLKNGNKIAQILKNRQLIIGWIIVVIGFYALINILILNNYGMMTDLVGFYAYNIMTDILQILYKMILPIICLFIGVKLIIGNTTKRKKELTQTIEQQND